jgi:hypothetical protein
MRLPVRLKHGAIDDANARVVGVFGDPIRLDQQFRARVLHGFHLRI